MSAYSVGCVTILVLASACAICDLRTGKIPNSFIICGTACASFFRLGLMFNAGIQHAAGILADGAAGMIVPFILFGWLVMLRMMGGGDVKLFSVIGLQFGITGGMKIIGYSIAMSALYSIFLVIVRRNLAYRLYYFFSYLNESLRRGRAGPYRQDGGDRSGEFCMAVPIFTALIVYCVKIFSERK